MTDDFLLDTSAVVAATNSLNGIHQALGAGLRSVVTDVESLLASGWNGSAAESFKELYVPAKSKFEQLIGEANDIMSVVPQVTDTLNGSDQSHASDLGRAQSSLDL